MKAAWDLHLAPPPQTLLVAPPPLHAALAARRPGQVVPNAALLPPVATLIVTLVACWAVSYQRRVRHPERPPCAAFRLAAAAVAA